MRDFRSTGYPDFGESDARPIILAEPTGSPRIEPTASRGAEQRCPRLPVVGDNGAMEAEPPKADPPKHNRRSFRFSLRTLMIVVAIVAVLVVLILPAFQSSPRGGSPRRQKPADGSAK
jgi:hypothetical protein